MQQVPQPPSPRLLPSCARVTAYRTDAGASTAAPGTASPSASANRVHGGAHRSIDCRNCGIIARRSPEEGPKVLLAACSDFPSVWRWQEVLSQGAVVFVVPAALYLDARLCLHVMCAADLACGRGLLLGSDTGQAEGEQWQVSRRDHPRKGVGYIHLEWYAACLRGHHFTRSAHLLCAPVQARLTERSERFGAPLRKCGNT